MRQALKTRPRNDATNQSCFWISERTMLPNVCDYCKGLQIRPYFVARTSPHSKRRIAVCFKRQKRIFTSIWCRWQNDEACRKSQLAHNWSGARVKYLDHIVQIDISHTTPHEQRENSRIHFIYEVSTRINRHHLYHKDQGIKMQRKH